MKIEAIPSFAAEWYSWIARVNPVIRDIHRDIAEELSSQITSGKLLDIGTGPGYVPLGIAKKSPQLEIIGADLSPKMVEIAQGNASEQGLSGRVKFQLADAATLPFENGSFDLVISTLSLHHWAHPDKAFKEIYRVLKKNGKAYIYDIRKDTTQEVEDAVRRKYGWFLSFLFLTVVRSHSSMLLTEAEKILSSAAAAFSQKNVQAKGVVLCLQAVK